MLRFMYTNPYHICELQDLSFDTFAREATLTKFVCRTSEKGSALKGMNLLPSGANFVLFRVEPISEGTWFVGKRTGNRLGCLPC